MFLYLDSPVDPIDPISVVYLILFFAFILVAFLLRNTALGFLWMLVKAFFIALFIVIVADKVKNELKDWLKD